MKQAQTGSVESAEAGAGAPLGLELRHLRYFVAVADVGSFTHAAERMFIAQPTLSQQIRRLEEIIGTPLLQRRREGLRLTTAGTVLLGASRDVLSLVDHGMSRTRQAAGLGRQRLRVVVPPYLPDCLAVRTTSMLRSAAEAADVDVTWLERPLDAEFSLIQQRQADAGVGWLTTGAEVLPAPLDAMNLGEFEPEVWIPATHPAARRGTMSLSELAGLNVIHGPRRTEPVTYDAWTRVLRAVDPRFEFTDPRRTGDQPERRSERLPLRRGERLQPAQERNEQLVQASEPHVHFRLDSGHPGHLHVVGLLSRPVQQCRLADARLPPQHQHPAQPIPDRGQHGPQRGSLHHPIQQRADRSALQHATVGKGRGFPGLAAMPESGA
jgi:DNA-binding transcriptional LysR family regulator